MNKFDNPAEIMATFEARGGGEMGTKRNIEDERYQATSKLGVAIIDTISQLPPYPIREIAKDLFFEWCDEEDGAIALTRLVTLIIH